MPHLISVPPTQALAALAPVQVRATSADQMDFAACPIRHSPECYTDASISNQGALTPSKASPCE
ncbi:hypothetical protein PR001_g7636 [Phytophthora rubi]|uniref:Uncharacterized protein n=1 Tax=Phytophthora rubi TaxID=129364 RepID=A0A6A3MVE6_9STRA|nr:hypothetical protein PR002_g7759 [Phytophthora rubi]KAE9039156.1 hypothetical protein PR001_g7636 [Phytophthora rubi]